MLRQENAHSNSARTGVQLMNFWKLLKINGCKDLYHWFQYSRNMTHQQSASLTVVEPRRMTSSNTSRSLSVPIVKSPPCLLQMICYYDHLMSWTQLNSSSLIKWLFTIDGDSDNGSRLLTKNALQITTAIFCGR